MKIIAITCYSVAIFGAAWMICVRASDWNTGRWGDGIRAMKLVFGAAAWVFVLVSLGDRMLVGDMGRADAVAIGSISGFVSGLVLYFVAA